MSYGLLGRYGRNAAMRSLFLLILAFPALAVYDPEHPPIVENFDPAEANPAGRIYCYGAPDIDIDIDIDVGNLPFNPNTRSLQKLCPKPQYGGGFPDGHAGAYCLGENAIAFDHSIGARVSEILTNPRFLLQCQQRCFCSTWKPWEHKGPKPMEYNGELEVPTYYIKADIVDDWFRNSRASRPTTEAHTIAIARVEEVSLRHEQLEQPQTSVLNPWTLVDQDFEEERPSIDLINHVISCADGPLPGPLAFMPMPMQEADYPYVHGENGESHSNAMYSICVNALDGGSP